jgi:hypothetical protein
MAQVNSNSRLVSLGDIFVSRKKAFKLIGLLTFVCLLSSLMIARPALAFISQNSQHWYWGVDTNVAAVATGDVDGDGQLEIVTGGYFNTGTNWYAQLQVWNPNTMAVKNVINWLWGTDTQVSCVAIGNITGSSVLDIVTGGSFFDGNRWIAQLHVWNGSTLAVEKVVSWYWGGDTPITSVAIGDVNGDGKSEIVTGGAFANGANWIAQLHVWNATTMGVINVVSWVWGSSTEVTSVAIGNVTGGSVNNIVTVGDFLVGSNVISQMNIWNGSTLAVEKSTTWSWGGNTYASAIAIANITGGTSPNLITGGYFFDGVRNHAQLILWNAATATPAVLHETNWYTISDTKIASIAIGNFTGGSTLDIISGGDFFDGTRSNSQIVDFNGATLVGISSANWFVTSTTAVTSVALTNFGQGNRLVAGGSYYDGVRVNSQLTIWL